MEVTFYGVHGNPETIGFTLDWSDPKFGFGQIGIDQDNKTGEILIDSESMSPEFVRSVLCALVDKATIK